MKKRHLEDLNDRQQLELRTYLGTGFDRIESEEITARAGAAEIKAAYDKGIERVFNGGAPAFLDYATDILEEWRNVSDSNNDRKQELGLLYQTALKIDEQYFESRLLANQFDDLPYHMQRLRPELEGPIQVVRIVQGRGRARSYSSKLIERIATDLVRDPEPEYYKPRGPRGRFDYPTAFLKAVAAECERRTGQAPSSQTVRRYLQEMEWPYPLRLRFPKHRLTDSS